MNDNPYLSPDHLLEQNALESRLRGPDYYYRPLNDLLLAHLLVAIGSVLGLCILDAVYRTLESREALSGASLPNTQDDALKLILVVVCFVTLLLLVAWHIVFLSTTMRLASNAHALGVPPPKATPLFAVISYLIPILNLYKPYQALRQFYQACDIRPSFILPVWWALHLFFTADFWIGLCTELFAESEFDFAYIEYPVNVCLVIFSQLLLTRLAVRQSELANLHPTTFPPPTANDFLPPMRFSTWGGD